MRTIRYWFIVIITAYCYTIPAMKGTMMEFSVLTKTFEKISAESSRTGMTILLADLLAQATPREAYIISTLSLGMLRPAYVGTKFNIAEKQMSSMVATLLHSTVEHITREAKKLGDLGLVVQEAQWHHKESPTLAHIYKQLCAIEEISGTGSQEEKAKQLLEVLKSVDPLSAKYIIRSVLGTLRLGFSDMTLIDALSWMQEGNKSLHNRIEHAYNICADIGLIAQTLKEGGMKAIDAMHIQIGIPIRPAAAERMPNPEAIIEKLGNCVAQPKLDGFRLQIHVDKTDPKHQNIHFFSRNLIDMSAMFPDVIEAIAQLNVKTLICEGEAIVYDPDTGSFLPFQETVKRKRKHGIEQAVSDYPLQVFIFDLLYLDGQEYLNKTHEQRRKTLLELFHNFPDKTIQVIEEKKVHSAQELEDYFEENIAAGLEGLVVKRPDAHYQPGKRNFNWIKLKRHSEGHLEDTIDCVILGYYAGSGKRAHFGIGAFLVGVYNPILDSFQTIAKIGTGLKDEEWKALKQQCDKLKVDHKLPNVICAKELYPDVWVHPEIVCAIRADEITLSPLHAAGKTEKQLGYALRFPRFMGQRPDKSATQATDIKEIQQLYEDQYKK